VRAPRSTLDDMKLRRRAVHCSFALLSSALGVAGVGCHRQAPATASSAPATPSSPFESQIQSGDGAQVRAQKSWCTYLDALYHRATHDGTRWPQLGECSAQTSAAAPEMLERTAACSQQALDGFEGDPFTPAYAAAVKRCGSTVLETLALQPEEVEPYVAVICERASACGSMAPGDCHADVSVQMGKRLGRALGALNAESRLTIRKCLATAECQDVADQISTCLEPVLDRLLWTPG
jgi:hypothetical protein